MKPYQLVVSALGILLETALLVALLARGRYRACLSFTVYVLAVLVPNCLFFFWRNRFYTWDNYVLKELVHTLLKFAIVLELGFRTFRAFPGAMQRARPLIAIALIVVSAVTLGALTSGRDPLGMQLEWQARVLSGTIWLFTALAGLILWYRVPVDPFNKAILVGFVPYLLVFSMGAQLLSTLGWERGAVFQRAHTISYVLLLLYWNRAAWRRDPAGVRLMRT